MMPMMCRTRKRSKTAVLASTNFVAGEGRNVYKRPAQCFKYSSDCDMMFRFDYRRHLNQQKQQLSSPYPNGAC